MEVILLKKIYWVLALLLVAALPLLPTWANQHGRDQRQSFHGKDAPESGTSLTPESGSTETPSGNNPAVDEQQATWNDCREGKHCSYPGDCKHYVDTNNNNLCDHGEAAPESETVLTPESGSTETPSGNNPAVDEQQTAQKSSLLEDLSQPVFLATLIWLLAAVIVLKLRLPDYIRLGLLLTSLIYLGFYTGGCICPIGAFQNLPVRLAGVLNGQYTYWLMLTLLPVAFVPFAGRIYCGSVCPMGAVQEFFFRAGRKVGLNMGNSGLGKMSWLKYVKYLVMAGIIIYSAMTGLAVFCDIEPFGAMFNLSVTATSLTILIAVLLLSLFISRPWCRIICPYGAFLALTALVVSPLSRLGGLFTPAPDIDNKKCKSCGACSRSCPVDAIAGGSIDGAECINCNRCKNLCSSKAIV